MSTTGSILLQRWRLHRDALLDLLDRLPESAAPVRVWPGGRDTLELVCHIAQSAEEYMAPALGRQASQLPVVATLAEGRNIVARQAEGLGREILARSEPELCQLAKVSRHNLAAPAAELIQLHVQHEAHHLGQLMYHARLLGIHPPYFVRNLWTFASPENWPQTPDSERGETHR